MRLCSGGLIHRRCICTDHQVPSAGRAGYSRFSRPRPQLCPVISHLALSIISNLQTQSGTNRIGILGSNRPQSSGVFLQQPYSPALWCTVYINEHKSPQTLSRSLWKTFKLNVLMSVSLYNAGRKSAYIAWYRTVGHKSPPSHPKSRSLYFRQFSVSTELIRTLKWEECKVLGYLCLCWMWLVRAGRGRMVWWWSLGGL